MRNRRGILAAPDAGPGKQPLGGVGCLLKVRFHGGRGDEVGSAPEIATSSLPQLVGGSGRKGRRPVGIPGSIFAAGGHLLAAS